MGSNDGTNFLAGNPIRIQVNTGDTLSTRYRIYSGSDYTSLLLDATAYALSGVATIDVSEIFASLASYAGFTKAKMVTVSENGTEYTGNDTSNLFIFNVYGGGISKGLVRKLTALNTNIFAWKLKKSSTNFFLTTRTNTSIICIPEDELMPLYYYAKAMVFTIKVNGVEVASRDHSADTDDNLQSIDFAALRASIVQSTGVLNSAFEICTGAGTSCWVLITEEATATNYYLRFLNSWGCWEKIALKADIFFNPAFNDNTGIGKWDAVVSDFVTCNSRKEVVNSNTAGVGYKTESERLFIIDLMLSDKVVLSVSGSEYEVNVSGELPALVSTDGNPVNVTLKIDLIDKENYFSELGQGSAIASPSSDPVYEYRWVYLSSSCLLSGGMNTGVLRTVNKKQFRIFPSVQWADISPQVTREVDTQDETACPVQTIRWDNAKSCLLDANGKNTGVQQTIATEQRFVAETQTWENTGNVRTRTHINLADCPLPVALPKEIRVSVGSPSYDAAIEEIYTYAENIQITIDCPLKNGYNYAFIQVPQGRILTVKNSMSVDVTSQWGVVGTDTRVGFQPNNIYRSSNVFSTGTKAARYFITIPA